MIRPPATQCVTLPGGLVRADIYVKVSPVPSNREEKSALANYQAAMKLYIWAVTELSKGSEVLGREEFEHLRTTVDYALDLYQTSRWELEIARKRISY